MCRYLYYDSTIQMVVIVKGVFLLLKDIIKFIKYLIFRMKIKAMDDFWYEHFGYCFGMYPPSFYYLHTPEEQERIKKEDLEELRKIVDEL